jgi:outer membrane protein assembly factor BamA
MNKDNTVWYKFLLLLLITDCLSLQKVISQVPEEKKSTHSLIINRVDKDSLVNLQDIKLQTAFINELQCTTYINNLPALLLNKGYVAASVDSIWSTSDTTFINLYLGKQFTWAKIKTDSIEPNVLAASGFFEKYFSNKFLNIEQLQSLQQRLLAYHQKNGYPFAQIYLDSIKVDEEKIDAALKVNTGVLYHIDSIRVYGKTKIANSFLQRHLGIYNGSLYNKEKLELVTNRILELPYLQQIQPATISMLGTGSTLNLYLAPKKSSQFNFLLGFLPSTNQASKFQLTADVNLDLKNALGNGESILLNWQQLQQKSPRLNLGYQQPYIFKSNFGIDFLFDLFKKDSTFVQVNGQLGIGYTVSAYQSGKVFVQWHNNFLLAGAVDTNQVKANKTLPANIDINTTGFGLEYNWIKTDYRLNPRSGNEIKCNAVAGIKKIKRNNDILSIKDPAFNYAALYDSLKEKTYQLRVKFYGAHYFPAGKQGTFKTSVNLGILNSPNIFRNELFQIGGYRLLRGFDEESIYATQYTVATVEYRYRLRLNSYLFGFTDGGWVKNKYQKVKLNNNFLSAGLGMVFETKFGLLNISYAMGKRNDVPFNLRSASKIHFGYVNYF